MRIPEHPTLIKQMIRSRVKKLQTGGPVLVASLVRIARRCGQPACPSFRVVEDRSPPPPPPGGRGEEEGGTGPVPG